MVNISLTILNTDEISLVEQCKAYAFLGLKTNRPRLLMILEDGSTVKLIGHYVDNIGSKMSISLSETEARETRFIATANKSIIFHIYEGPEKFKCQSNLVDNCLEKPHDKVKRQVKTLTQLYARETNKDAVINLLDEELSDREDNRPARRRKPAPSQASGTNSTRGRKSRSGKSTNKSSMKRKSTAKAKDGDKPSKSSTASKTTGKEVLLNNTATDDKNTNDTEFVQPNREFLDNITYGDLGLDVPNQRDASKEDDDGLYI